jgi:LysM repeat protein
MTSAAHTGLAIVSVLVLTLIVASLGLTPIAASPPTGPVTQATATHIVQPGDTLYSLARRYGTTVAAIMEANGLSNPDFIWVGQRLIIPLGVLPSPTPGCEVTHVVQRGETLYAIARRYSTTVAAIMEANGLSDPDFIWVGQRLTIPVCSTSTPTASPTPTGPVPTASPTPTGPTSTPSPSATPTATPSPTSVCEVIYTVQWGDTLSSIARRFGTTVAAIVAANDLPSPDFIWVGQRLTIPVCGTPIPTLTPPPGGEQWIDVNLSTQTLIAYQGATPVLQTLISSGTAQYPSPVGTFYVYLKLISQDMYGPGYYLPDVPYVMYFYSGYAIHGTYWHDNFGQPMSHGCINLPIPEAGWLFEWAPMGTPVVLHY